VHVAVIGGGILGLATIGASAHTAMPRSPSA